LLCYTARKLKGCVHAVAYPLC